MDALSSQDRPLSVSALTQELRGVIESRFAKLYVEAEISGWRPYPSGHVYFTLKDEGAQISAVMFKSSFDRCKAKAALRDGAKVIVYANASVYAPKGNYQLIVLAAKLVGEGDLMQRYLELKARLEREGLFAASRKRKLPFLPRRIGLVTSPAGAVVHDMCRVLMRRLPAVEIRLFPASVQGAEAPASLIAGLEYFNSCVGGEWSPDVVIIARGGGSFEDLFCFNDEGLVRAIAAAKLPVISAVGHETDFTLCDFVADVRAGTPSIAAELAVPELAELRRKLKQARASTVAALRAKYEWFSQRVDALADRFGKVFDLRLVRAEAALRELSVKLSLLSPYSVLDRGYSLTTDEQGAVLRDADKVAPGTILHTRLAHGELTSVARD